MGMLVTMLLVIMNMFNSALKHIPRAKGITASEAYFSLAIFQVNISKNKIAFKL